MSTSTLSVKIEARKFARVAIIAAYFADKLFRCNGRLMRFATKHAFRFTVVSESGK